MTRVRALLWVSALGLSAHARADGPDWKPAEAKPAATTAPAAPPPAPGADPSSWQPAKVPPAETPPQPNTPAAADVPVFRSTTAEPAGRELTPAVLPPIQPIPKPIDTPKPDDLAKPPTSEQLPPPRVTPTPPPVVSAPPIPVVQGPPVVQAPPSPYDGVVTTLQDACPPSAPPHPHTLIPAGSVSTPPVRGRTFGSPSLNLSRDYYVRDLFGLDLLTAPPRGVGPDGTVLPDAPASDLFFFQADFLMWWTNRYQIPVLATTSTGPAGFGFLGDPTTRTLLGPGDFGPSFRNGMRIRGGGYFDECDPVGVDGSFFFLGTASQKAVFDSAVYPVITRPFFSPNAGVINTPNGPVPLPGEFGEVVARPGLSTGRLEVETDSYLWGADVNYRRGLCRTCTGGTGWFAGYRHVNLTERLRITEFLTASGSQAPDPVGTQVVVQDSFETRNRFHGGQVGYLWNRRGGRWDVDVRLSVALGVTHQILDIDGFQRRTRPGQATENFRGGLLAAGPNIGRFTSDRFSVVPEGTVNFGYLLSPAVRVSVGYNFLYWSNVIRPGDQIDRTVDVTFVPNPPAGVPASGTFRPQPTFKQSDLWVQGIQLGAELRW